MGRRGALDCRTAPHGELVSEEGRVGVWGAREREHVVGGTVGGYSLSVGAHIGGGR